MKKSIASILLCLILISCASEQVKREPTITMAKAMVSKTNAIQVAFHRIEVASDYKYLGMIEMETSANSWTGSSKNWKTDCEQHLFIKTNGSGKVDKAVIVRIYRILDGGIWAYETNFENYKTYLQKGTTEVLGLSTKYVISRFNAPNKIYLDLIIANGLEIDASNKKFIEYIFGKNSTDKVRFEVLYYEGEIIPDNVKAVTNLRTVSDAVKVVS